MRNGIEDRSSTPAARPAPMSAELKEAYQRGRRDERARRRRSPLAILTVSMAALAGAGILAVSAWQGSFMQGGAVVDQHLVTAAETAEPRLQAAAQDARSALRQASREAKTRAQGLVGG